VVIAQTRPRRPLVSYEHFEREASANGDAPKRDMTDAWGKLTPVMDADDRARGRIARFCDRKRITVEALAAFGARYAVRRELPCLAYAGTNGNGKVVAIKYRPIDGPSSEIFNEDESVWVRPIIAGDPTSLNWMISEGETDAARLYELTGGNAGILVLPCGALTFKTQWADTIPRGATVALCHDADDPGDQGAAKAAQILGGRTIRVRPPIDGGDWCDWDGDRGAFLELVQTNGSAPHHEFLTYAEFSSREFPTAEPLLGEPGRVFLARGSLFMVYGADGCGKSTWSIDGLVHLASGVDWLGIPVPRPVRIAIIENEGPPGLFQQKLRDKVAGWEGPDPTPNLFVYAGPWGEFSFADADARTALCRYCDQHRIDVVSANPTLGLGVGTSGKPDETQQFVDWLCECGLKRDRAFWLLHHENKSGQISGDWGRHPDAKVFLQRDGNKARTRLDWAKTRWAVLEPKVAMLEWVIECQGYTVTELDTVGASDGELDERIREFLQARPASSTRAVWDAVKGTNARISKRLEDGPFDCVRGPRNAKLWFSDRTATDDRFGAPNQWDENPDE
jgi:AAA domain